MVFIAHSLFNAYIKWALNGWYESFYDTLQTSVSDTLGQHANGTFEFNLTQSEVDFLTSKQQEVSDLLIEFVIIVAPILVVHPVCKFISSVWRFSWRIALVNSYLAHYDASQPSLEGTAQRIQEDTSRFEEGVYSAFNIVLDSILTLAIFTPLLIESGKTAKPSWVPDWFDGWLAYGAFQASLSGLFISMFVGRKLVDLEVQNQRVEAKFRTKLVILEESPTSLIEDTALVAYPPDVEVVQANIVVEDGNGNGSMSPRIASDWTPLPCFVKILRELWNNYKNLFIQYTYMNTWIAFYDQAMVILPYIVIAPLMFAVDPSRRITLGTLVKITNAFGKVFDSLAVVSQSWAAINDFRSVIRRLREFERQTYSRRAFNQKTVYSELVERSAPSSRTNNTNNPPNPPRNLDNSDPPRMQRMPPIGEDDGVVVERSIELRSSTGDLSTRVYVT